MRDVLAELEVVLHHHPIALAGAGGLPGEHDGAGCLVPEKKKYFTPLKKKTFYSTENFFLTDLYSIFIFICISYSFIDGYFSEYK